MRIVKIVIVVVLALILIPVGLLALLAATDLAPARGLIASRLSSAVGREVSIAGTTFDLLPSPRLSMTTVGVEGVGNIDVVDLHGSWSGGRPTVTGRIAAETLDLRPLLPPKPAPGASGGKTPEGPLFSTDPLPFDQLQRANGRLEVSTGRLTLHDGVIDRADAVLRLDAGRLRIEPLRIALAGGAVEGAVTADAAAVPASLHVGLKGSKLALDGLLALAAQPAWLRAPVDAEVDLRARGAAPSDLVRSLDGQVTLITGGGRLAPEIVDALFAKVGGLASMLPRARLEQAARLRCGAYDLIANAGIIDIRTGIIDTAAGRILVDGTVNLGREQLDLILLPQIALLDPSASVPVTVSGPLTKARVGIDRAAAVDRLAALVSGVEPASAEGFSRLGGNDRPCGGGAASESRLPEIPRDPAAARDLLQRGLKGLLGR